MKKAIFLATLLFASASVFGTEDAASVSLRESGQNSKFVEAMKAGDIEQVEQLIKDGVDVNSTMVDGTTPLIFAVNADNYNLVDTLIRLDADTNAEDSHHKTALSTVVDVDDISMVRLLVKIGKADIYKNGVFDRVMSGPDSEVKDFLSTINVDSLIKAIQSSDVDGVEKALEDERIDVNIRDDIGYTPLMYAAARGNLQIIDLLLNKGARVDVVSKKPSGYDRYNDGNFGDNALFFAARNGKTEALELLMNVSGHDVKEAVSKSNKWKDLRNNVFRSALRSMINVKSLLKQRNNLGQTLLISALKNSREDTALWLIDHGANVNDTYEAQYGELHKDRSTYEESPLMIAAVLGQPRAVSKLLEKGVDINFRNKKGTALDYVLQSEEETPRESRDKVVQILINKGLLIDDTKAFWPAIRRGYLETVRRLMEGIGDVNLRNREGKTPLRISIEKGYFDVAELLLQNGADVNLLYTDTESSWEEEIVFKRSLLHWAVRKGYSNEIGWLINHRADVNSQEVVKVRNTRWGGTETRKETPLSIAQSELSKVKSELLRVQLDETSEEEVARLRVQRLQKEKEKRENIVSLLQNAGAKLNEDVETK